MQNCLKDVSKCQLFEKDFACPNEIDCFRNLYNAENACDILNKSTCNLICFLRGLSEFYHSKLLKQILRTSDLQSLSRETHDQYRDKIETF